MVDAAYNETERTALLETVRVLEKAARIPYNNATIAYHLSDEQPDRRFGGSCLDKLRDLEAGLQAIPGIETRYLVSSARKSTHFAMVASLGQKQWYLDPFLWQQFPLATDAAKGARVPSLFRNWEIEKQSSSQEPLKVGFFDITGGNKGESELLLITHEYLQDLDTLPPWESLGTNPYLPSFQMQFPTSDGSMFVKLWIDKDNERIHDIWLVEAGSGKRRKVPREGVGSYERETTVRMIENELGCSEEALIGFFSKAVRLERGVGARRRDWLEGGLDHDDFH